MNDVLMPKATAVWLVDNTSLTFEQIADFAGLHPLEVKGIADGEVARDIRGWRFEEKDVYAYFDNDIGGAAPRDAQRLKRLFNL